MSKNNERVPREVIHDQDERLTNKHIQTLGFLQEIVNENKALKLQVQELEEKLSQCEDIDSFAQESKEKIKSIQESYLARADEINSMLAEKHRVEMMQLQEEKLETERELKEQILQMRHEIESLRDANTDLRETAAEEANSNVDKNKLKELSQLVKTNRAEREELEEEMESLRTDLKLLQTKKASDLSQIRELRAENKGLTDDLQEVKQKNMELEFRLDKALGELKEKSEDQEQLALIENLRDKVQQLSLERESNVGREDSLNQKILDLESRQAELHHANQQLQAELQTLLAEYGHLAVEHEKLRKRCLKDKDKKTFKDFVSLKRQLNSLKDENQELKSKSSGEKLTMIMDDSRAEVVPEIQKKNSLTGTRAGAKKMLAISLGSNK